MNCKPGDLARAIGGPTTPEMNNLFVVVERQAYAGESHSPGTQFNPTESGVHWVIRHAVLGEKLPARTSDGVLRWVERRGYASRLLRPINGDNPGNEHWVTEARKSIPRPIPVTGPVTIDHRGEPA